MRTLFFKLVTAEGRAFFKIFEVVVYLKLLHLLDSALDRCRHFVDTYGGGVLDKSLRGQLIHFQMRYFNL